MFLYYCGRLDWRPPPFFFFLLLLFNFNFYPKIKKNPQFLSLIYFFFFMCFFFFLFFFFFFFFFSHPSFFNQPIITHLPFCQIISFPSIVNSLVSEPFWHFELPGSLLQVYTCLLLSRFPPTT